MGNQQIGRLPVAGGIAAPNDEHEETEQSREWKPPVPVVGKGKAGKGSSVKDLPMYPGGRQVSGKDDSLNELRTDPGGRHVCETRSPAGRVLFEPHQTLRDGNGHTACRGSDSRSDDASATTTKLPTYEYYGFALYLASFALFGIYLLWAYLPDEALHRIGITYYPSRYWAIAIPVWVLVFMLFMFVAFFSITLLNTAPFDSYNTLVDEYANIMRPSDLAQTMQPDAIPELQDIPICTVNACLYGAKRAT